MALFFVILIALILRVLAALFMPVMDVDDSYTWWILSVQTNENNFVYTDSWKGHHRIFPPGYAVATSFLMALFSTESIWVPRLLNIFAGAFAVAITYIIVQKLIGKQFSSEDENQDKLSLENAPFVAALLLAINPFHINYSSSVGNETFFSALLVFIFYLLMKTEKTSNFGFIAAIFLVLASLTRYEIWMTVPFIIWAIIKQKRATWPQFISCSLIFSIGPLTWFWWQEKFFGSWSRFLEHYLSGAGASSSSISGNSIQNAIATMWIPVGITVGIGVIAILYGLHFLWRKNASTNNQNLGFSKTETQNFTLVYGYLITFLVVMVVISALGWSPAWTRYHVNYLPFVYMVFGVAYIDKIIPLFKNFKKINIGPISMLVTVVILNIMLFFSLPMAKPIQEHHNYSLIEAGKVLSQHYQEGMIINDLPAVIFGTGLPINKFIHSGDFPDDPSKWGDFLKTNKVKFIVWTSADYGRISRINEDLLKNNLTGVKFKLIYSVDPNTHRKCHIYEILSYGI
ncbi:MAG: hypothetical protein ACQ9MH_07990 [Nitrospinales bacterium]